MAKLKLYTLFHLNIAYSAIEEELRPDVIRCCYWPLLRLARKFRLPIGIEASGFTLETVEAIDPTWTVELKSLCDEGICEFIGSGYAQIIGPLVPAKVNAANLRLGNEVYKRVLGFRPEIVLVNEQAYSSGMIEHYLTAGYHAMIMEWDNPAHSHPDWPSTSRHLPAYAIDQHGRKIALIWNKSVSFQMFQRYAHSELDLDEYLGWLETNYSEEIQAFPLYGNDVEVFDFRPGRYETEAPLNAESEWSRIELLVESLLASGRVEFIKPSEVLDLLSLPGAGSHLRLESPDQPTPVKKQGKYNITRWAVTGRDDLKINTLCWRIYEAMEAASPTDDDWRELCYLWSSDFRTHITQKRWDAYIKLLEGGLSVRSDSPASLEGGHSCPPISPPLAGGARGGCRIFPSSHSISRQGRFLTVNNDRFSYRFNCRRGLTLDSLIDRTICLESLCGTLSLGYYDDNLWSADFYTGHMLLEAPGRPKLTDLNPVEPEITTEGGLVTVKATIQTKLGEIQKSWQINTETGRLTLTYDLDWTGDVTGSLRLGAVTLIPTSFNPDSLFYETCNGGNDPERFALENQPVDLGKPVSFLVSASHALGVTSGQILLGDENRGIRVTVEKSSSALVGFITFQKVRDSYFFRLSFSAREMDDTSKPSPLLLRSVIHIDPVAFSGNQ